MAIMSVQAIKGVEVGDAFENAKRIGTQAHDPIQLQNTEGGMQNKTFDLRRSTNRAGGTEGGISNGQPIIIRAAMKPIATTLLPQPTVDLATGQNLPPNMSAPIFVPSRVLCRFWNQWLPSFWLMPSSKNSAATHSTK
jgi:chorismate synthase